MTKIRNAMFLEFCRQIDKTPRGELLPYTHDFLGTFSELSAQASQKLREGTEWEMIHVRNGIVEKFLPLNTRGVDETIIKRLIYHNHLFSRCTPYTVAGWSIDESGCEFVVLQQPYVKLILGQGEEARKKLMEDLTKRFGHVEIGNTASPDSDWYILNENLWLDDLKNANVGLDEMSKDYAVIDCIIRDDKTYEEFRAFMAERKMAMVQI